MDSHPSIPSYVYDFPYSQYITWIYNAIRICMEYVKVVADLLIQTLSFQTMHTTSIISLYIYTFEYSGSL